VAATKRSQNQRAAREMRAASDAPMTHQTHDSFQNFITRVGLGTGNVNDGAQYGFNPISRNRNQLGWMYRGSWIVGQVVDVVADDMTRAGIDIISENEPDVIDKVHAAFRKFVIWERLNQTIKWARLYGGAVAVILIDGQAPETPLRLDRVGKNSFKGLLVFDRWMLQPTLNELNTELGVDFSMPLFYETIAQAPALPRMRIHYSRCVRVDGVELPYWDRIGENLWGISVIERLFDRLIAFDSATAGASQLVHKAWLRTMSVDGLRELIAAGGPALNALVNQMNMIRRFQTNEGITLIDAKDKFEVHRTVFAGLDDLLLQFGQQLSGATQIPLVRLFGQSPAGLNSTGESDIRNYYDGINQHQERRLRRPLDTVLDVLMNSEGIAKPEGFHYEFAPLWQLSDKEKADVAQQYSSAIINAHEANLIGDKTAMQELKALGRATGLFTNITSEQIDRAEEDPPDPMELAESLSPLGEQAGDGTTPARGQGDVPAMRRAANDGVAQVDVHGMQVVIETAKGERREGAGWSVNMPAHYGYIRGTSSQEGPHEQMDCYLGQYPLSQRVWVVEQLDADTGAFDEHKVMLGYRDKESAIDDYLAAHSDGRGPDRLGSVRRMDIAGLKRWLQDWRFGRRAVSNGTRTVIQ
jgi:phage-related protein (TIGR01555 family)